MHSRSSGNADAYPSECAVCPHRCILKSGAIGLCGARGNVDSKIISLNYGQATALALDPIEKKPLAMYMSGSEVLSYGSYGCNMRCPFCQNSHISMARASSDGEGPQVHTRFISPGMLADLAEEAASHGNIGAALTYNEPMVSPEYLMDAGAALHMRGLKLVAVTNGYSSPDVWDKALGVTDALNVDLKCFNEAGYTLLGAPDGLETVKRNIVSAVRAGVHIEVTTLIVPGFNDDPEEFAAECDWLRGLNPGIPLHISRFFPQFKMADSSPTDTGLMHRLERIAQERLESVFLGNI